MSQKSSSFSFALGLLQKLSMVTHGKVLIADDEPDILEILKYNLEKEGYQVSTAKDGNEALDKAKLYQPDLIVLDMMMPKKSGMEVLAM